MTPENLKKIINERELVFTATRSSGPGGQNVNKVSTRIELRFIIKESGSLNSKQKELLFKKLGRKINSEGELIIISQTERSQLRNKEKALEKFYSLLSKSLTVKRSRIATRPTISSKLERLESKRKRSMVKKARGKSDLSDD